MSASDYDVMQEKEADAPVVWKDFVGLGQSSGGCVGEFYSRSCGYTSETPVASERHY
jgi:hypothetical protein